MADYDPSHRCDCRSQNIKMFIQSLDPHNHAGDEGWTFIISLFNRMGSGYIFDRTEITKMQESL